uniref:SFRICE_036404 n=1 Tax=Spodoptera frugiperda TaxID=7108 RepID=A0A2H1X2Q8_SPOFR
MEMQLLRFEVGGSSLDSGKFGPREYLPVQYKKHDRDSRTPHLSPKAEPLYTNVVIQKSFNSNVPPCRSLCEWISRMYLFLRVENHPMASPALGEDDFKGICFESSGLEY